MANQQPDLSLNSIGKAEHIDPATTGDNIAAKKVANYVWDGVSTWTRMTQAGGGGGGGTTNSSNTIDAAPATQNITAQDVGSTTVTTNANSQSVTTGSATAGSTASFALAGYDSAAIQVTGTWTGTLVSQISFDGGTTWYNQGLHQTGTAFTATSFTANFSGRSNTAGATNWRVESTTAWTGTATVKVVASVNPSITYLGNNSKIADGTTPSTQATVKAGSTSPVATDTALVVAMSPNSINNTLNAELGDFTGTITNATQTTPVVATGLAGYDNVFISINGTYTGATAVFQGSDDGGTTWYNTNVAARIDTPIIEGGYTNLSSISRGWNLNIQGFDSVRVNPSAVATGTVNVRISAESAPTNAGATVQSLITNGTNVTDVVAGDAGFNGVAMASGTKTIPFTSGGTTGAQTIAANTDIRGYAWIEVVIATVGVGLAWTGQFAPNTGGNYTQANTWTNTPNGSPATIGTTQNIIYGSSVKGNFFQLPVTVLTSGTYTGFIILHATAPPYATILAAQSGAWTVGSNSATGSAVPANAFLMAYQNATDLLTALRSSGKAGLQGASTDTTPAFAPYLYNNATEDMMRNNTTGVVIAAGATSTQTAVALTTYNAKKLIIVANITAGAGSIVVAINAATSSAYTYPLLTSASLTGVTTTPLRIFPGATPSANAVANDVPPRNVQITVTVTGTITYGVDYVLAV